MKIGKLTISDLNNLIFNNIKNNDNKVLSSGEIGSDCAAIEVGENVVYLSTDPITGTNSGLGKLAININCNDIATEGIPPVGIMLTILAPPHTEKDEIAKIMKEAQEEAQKLGVSIIGGHTEITTAVNKTIISATSIGIGKKSDFKRKENIKAGDRLVITKGVGIEGTGIIAFDKESELQEVFPTSLIEEAKSLLDLTSVVKDGVIANSFSKGMHDVTEGGLLGALWESSCFYNLGLEIFYEKIFIHQSTKEICKYFKINPLKLISSGTMLIIVDENKVNFLLEKLKENGINAFNIGKFTESNEKVLIKNGERLEIASPESDELYKVI
ncbi:AIR synthase family protein [Candidatus Cetobacterium colombiensis]|uniref:AIR synthase family protein n=1 Tax=Candidatus Cetobacterium colombiensis TaxID=3073100 RepID=A0ABU4W8N2_9FUSO|nr:AIR synthase family protein [Candidatus Cetobacterium colombiensis]MDX8335407.1 AIR synthase family protein [Candidatus Cetobacterium colombiensis]